MPDAVSPNQGMRRLAQGLSQWRRRYSGATGGREARDELQEYVCANEQPIRQALDTVDAMNHETMLALLREHSELNVPEGVDVGYARQLVDALCGPGGTGWILTDIDDYANVLKRVIEYAQFA